MDPISEAIKESVINEIKELPWTLTAEDVREKTQLGWNKVYKLLRLGSKGQENGIPCRKIDGQYRVARADFVQWLYRRETA